MAVRPQIEIFNRNFNTPTLPALRKQQLTAQTSIKPRVWSPLFFLFLAACIFVNFCSREVWEDIVLSIRIRISLASAHNDTENYEGKFLVES